MEGGEVKSHSAITTMPCQEVLMVPFVVSLIKIMLPPQFYHYCHYFQPARIFTGAPPTGLHNNNTV